MSDEERAFTTKRPFKRPDDEARLGDPADYGVVSPPTEGDLLNPMIGLPKGWPRKDVKPASPMKPNAPPLTIRAALTDLEVLIAEATERCHVLAKELDPVLVPADQVYRAGHRDEVLIADQKFTVQAAPGLAMDVARATNQVAALKKIVDRLIERLAI